VFATTIFAPVRPSAARAALDLTGAKHLKICAHKKGEPKLPFFINSNQPMVIKLALPPAAAVFTLTARSITNRSSAIW